MVYKGLYGNSGSFEAGLPAHAVRVDPYDLVKLEFLLLSHALRIYESGQARKLKSVVGAALVAAQGTHKGCPYECRIATWQKR